MIIINVSNTTWEITFGGVVIMSKKKKFLSLLMGAISSLSIVGAKGKKSEVKGTDKSISVSTSQSKNMGKTNGKSENKNTKKSKISLNDTLAKRIRSEILPNWKNLSYLENQDDAKIFSEMFGDKKFKEAFVRFARKKDFNSASKLIIQKFNSLYIEQVISDLKQTVNNVTYGFINRWKASGCCVSLNESENRLGKKYYYELSDLRDLNSEEAESIVLRTVLSHLMISNFRRLEGKSDNEKSMSDLMKQIILSGYVSQNDSLDNVSKNLAKKIGLMIDRYNSKEENEKISVSWLKKAMSSVSKDRFGDGYSWSWFSKIGLKSRRYFFPLSIAFPHTFDEENKLNFVK